MKYADLNRRSFLSASSVAIGAAAVSHVCRAWAQISAGQEAKVTKIPTPDTRMKFNPDGSRRPFRGNTVICHLQPQGNIRDAVDAIRESLTQSSLASKIALLPPTSYHMTVYPGVNDQGREITGWPPGLAAKASIDECTQFIGERMRRFHLQCDLPLRMKVDSPKTVANLRATSLRMTGASPKDEADIRSIRDRLVDVFGYRDKNHDEYSFHVTLAYQLAPFTREEQQEHASILAKHIPRIEKAGPIFEFGNPEFCFFPDMFQYDIEQLLPT